MSKNVEIPRAGADASVRALAIAVAILAGCGGGPAANRPPTEPPAAAAVAPAPAAPVCDMALFHRWETGKLVENCMAAKPCVVDERLTEHACFGSAQPAACLGNCVNAGLRIIAEAYHTDPPDLAACVDCLGAAYARYLAECGAQCPACPADSPAALECRKCADAGRFFAACLANP